MFEFVIFASISLALLIIVSIIPESRGFISQLIRSEVFLGAFFASFLTLLFSQVGRFTERVTQRRRTHLNSLIRLQADLVSQGGIITTMIRRLKGMQEIITSGSVTYEVLDLIPLNRELFLDLLSTELVNSFQEHYSKIEITNSVIKSFRRSYNNTRDNFLQENIKPDVYKKGLKNILPTIEDLIRSLQSTLERTEKLIATLRVMQRLDVPLVIRVERIFTRNKTLERNTLIEKELRKVKDELQGNQ